MTGNPCDVNTVRCAVCWKLREQANHWFLIWLSKGFHCYPFDIAPRQPNDLPVCGQACAQKEFERWMTAVRNNGSSHSGPENDEGPRAQLCPPEKSLPVVDGGELQAAGQNPSPEGF